MENIYKILLLIGTLLCIFLFAINIYLGATGAIVLAAFALSVFIMEDLHGSPRDYCQSGGQCKKDRG